MKQKFVVLNEKDNVAIAISPLKEGEEVVIRGRKIKILTEIPLGHKFALRDIKKGEKVLKDGEVIGEAIVKIKVGEHVHIHNLKSLYRK